MKKIIIILSILILLLIAAIVANKAGYENLTRLACSILLLPWFSSFIIIFKEARKV